jgi:transcriptional regulator with XRE-family HTH domain
MNYFAERLKAARKRNGFSLQDLSDIINNKHNKQLLHRLESGTALPDSDTLSLLAKTLKVPADYFFKEANVKLEDIRFRKLKKLPVKEQEKIIAQTTDVLERYTTYRTYPCNATAPHEPS